MYSLCWCIYYLHYAIAYFTQSLYGTIQGLQQILSKKINEKHIELFVSICFYENRGVYLCLLNNIFLAETV